MQVVLASSILVVLGVPLVSPALPAVKHAFSLTDAEASLLITLYTLPGIVFAPLAAVLADRYGRRPVLVPSLFGFALAGASVALLSSFPVVLAARFVQGACAAGIFTLTIALVADGFDGDQRRAVFGANVAVLSLSAAAAPLVGGVLAEFGWNLPFAVFLVGLPIAVFAARTLVDTSRATTVSGLAYLRGSVAALPARPAAAFYGAAFAISFLLLGALFTALPFLLSESFGRPPADVGLVLTASTLATAVTSLVAGRVTAGLSEARVLVAGAAIVGSGVLAAALAPSVLFLAAAAVSFGVGAGLAFPAIDSAVSRLSTARYRAGALALRNSVGFLGSSVGPVVVTVSAELVGYPWVLAGLGAGTLGAAIVGWVVGSRSRHSAVE